MISSKLTPGTLYQFNSSRHRTRLVYSTKLNKGASRVLLDKDIIMFIQHSIADDTLWYNMFLYNSKIIYILCVSFNHNDCVSVLGT